MQEKITAKDQEALNSLETVKRLYKSCRDLLEKGGDTSLKPDGSHIITPAKKIGKKLNLYFSTDPIAGGILNREKALSGPLFVYICRKKAKKTENIMLVELNANGRCKINSFVKKDREFYGGEMRFNKPQILEDCERFIARFRTLP